MVLSDDEPEPQPNPIAEPGGSPEAGGASDEVAAARPEKVVVVLNGTPIDGLASRYRDELLAAGYSDEQGMIRIDNSDDQQRQDSIVYYKDNERRQARDVSRLLDITRTEEIDDETQALADSSDETGTLPADVTVLLGADKSP
jgi:LytR cell envelope-related transcriptional attenuator